MTGNAKLSTTSAREQKSSPDPQVYGRYPYPGEHRKKKKTMPIIAFVGSAKSLGAAVVVASSVLPGKVCQKTAGRTETLVRIAVQYYRSAVGEADNADKLSPTFWWHLDQENSCPHTTT